MMFWKKKPQYNRRAEDKYKPSPKFQEIKAIAKAALAVNEPLIILASGLKETTHRLAYVTDMDTYEILWLNKGMVEAFQDYCEEDCLGDICYKIFHGRNKPCEFCTNHLIRESGSLHTWFYFNEQLKREFFLQDMGIDWNGRVVRFEIATDVTELMEARRYEWARLKNNG